MPNLGENLIFVNLCFALLRYRVKDIKGLECFNMNEKEQVLTKFSAFLGTLSSSELATFWALMHTTKVVAKVKKALMG